MTPDELVRVAQEVKDRFPLAMLVKNPVGNLAILVDDQYVGFIDLQTAELEVLR